MITNEETKVEDENAVKENVIENLKEKLIFEKANNFSIGLFSAFLEEHKKLHGTQQDDFFKIENYALCLFSSRLLSSFAEASCLPLTPIVSAFCIGIKELTHVSILNQETCKWLQTQSGDYHNPDIYKCGCGESHQFCCDLNIFSFTFCPYCGKEIEEIKE